MREGIFIVCTLVVVFKPEQYIKQELKQLSESLEVTKFVSEL